jgi:hypothetical protein
MMCVVQEGVVTISTVVELVFSVRPVRSSTPGRWLSSSPFKIVFQPPYRLVIV